MTALAVSPDRALRWRSSGLRRRVLHPVLATWRFLAAQPRPILVYQMSKVGSTSVCTALYSAGLRPLHVHFLGPIWAECRDAYRRSGTPLPLHIYVEGLLRPYLRLTSHHLKVVTLTRDPIAWHVSSAFQTARRDGYDVADVSGTVERLRAELLDGRGIDYCASWFDRELRTVFGVDVLTHEFDRRRGCSIVRGDRVTVLTLKIEALGRNWETLSQFVGRTLHPAKVKQRLEQSGAGSYREVGARLQLPVAALEQYYDHPWMRHFYTEAEVKSFCARWSA